MTRLRVALIGWGAIGQEVGRLLVDDPIDVVAIGVKDIGLERANVPTTATLITSPVELAAIAPHVVAEAAGRDSVEPWGSAALHAGADYVVSSVSAFANPDVLERLRSIAVESGTQIHIQPGALGGVDALAAARLMGVEHVEHRMVKPPAAWSDTPAESLCNLEELTEPTVFFQAPAAETARAFPKNANVAMTTALAGIGPEHTVISLVADPTATTNRHEIKAHGAFGSLDVAISNSPLPGNPKSSAMAALNLARSIKNRVAAMII